MIKTDNTVEAVNSKFPWITMADIKQIAETVGAAMGAGAALVTALVQVNKRVIQPLRQWFERTEDIHRIVNEQLVSNGGSSMRDAVGRLEMEGRAHRASFRGWMTLATDARYAIFETDANGACVWVNPVYKNWVGRSDEEVMGDSWAGVIYPEDREAVWEAWQMAVEQKRDFSGTYRLQFYDGTPFWVHCIAVVKRGPHQIHGWLGRLERVAEPIRGCTFLS